ncbi:MAG: TetR/AcrR family transcriptional regulator [Bacteroidota bacterium]
MPKAETFDRTEVIQKATQLFWKKGYHATSMQDLVDTTGLNRSSIYNSFEDKFNLFLECLKMYQGNERAKALQVVFKETSPIKAIKVFFRNGAKQSFCEKNGCFIVNATTELGKSDSLVVDFLEKNERSLKKMFKDLLDDAKAKDELDKSEDTEALASYLFSSFQGIRVTSILAKDELELNKIADYTLSVLK